MKILEVKNLSVSFNRHQVIKNLDVLIERDTTVAIVGPNGSGKTVLFKCLLGLTEYQGQVLWASDVRIGYVPQKLFVQKDLPLTVLEFLNLKEVHYSKLLAVLSSVGFKKNESDHSHNDTRVLKAQLSSLSGGELQRVLMAYALLGDPNVLLLDEPTAGVDIEGEKTFYALFKELKKDKDLTIIFISHDPEAVKLYADKVIKMDHEH